MGFVKVASAKDLEQSHILGVESSGKEILLVNYNGSFYAIGNRCTHMGCMLSDGKLGEGNVKCICHGSVFDIKTGNVLKGPANKPEPAFQVKLEGDQILVDI